MCVLDETGSFYQPCLCGQPRLLSFSGISQSWRAAKNLYSGHVVLRGFEGGEFEELREEGGQVLRTSEIQQSGPSSQELLSSGTDEKKKKKKGHL